MSLKSLCPLQLRAVAVLAALLSSSPADALVVPGANGSDGELNITQNTVIDLSQAPTGVWDATSPQPGKGIYDPEKWAIVFHYSKVTVASGATLSFLNHPSKAPVVWLVNGDVSIVGVVSLDGAQMGDGGPGGARGAYPLLGSNLPSGGFGLGGSYTDTGGSFATLGTSADIGHTYGGPSLVPLVGGSGAGMMSGAPSTSGGGGGGAILIAATGTLAVEGIVHANGGAYYSGGSGGGIRLCGQAVSGSGSLGATGGNATYSGGAGRIRIEANQVSGSLQASPAPSSVLLTDPVVLWPPSDAPTVRVTSVNAITVPVTAAANWSPSPPDLTLGGAALYDVLLETKNLPTTRKVRVKMTPSSGNATLTDATLVSGNATLAMWKAQVQFGQGFCTVQARVDAQ